MKTVDFDYLLPPERIAHAPVSPRDTSRLMVLQKATETITHRRFFEIGEFLRPGDLLVVNESRVFKARLRGSVGAHGHAPTSDRTIVEIFLLRPEGPYWLALGNPGKKLTPGTQIRFDEEVSCIVKEKRDEDGTILVDFACPAEDVFAFADRMGEVPTPPYIHPTEPNAQELASTYQTVYAKTTGSVAAPTAGFHFTPELIEKLKINGIQFATVTLHVGIGTFRPVKVDDLADHVMHEEWIDVPDATLRAIEETKKNGGRVIAVGTTTVRALESEVRHGFTNMFITPGYQFKYIDGLITNFHMPKSTLLVLVSAFAGREFILRAYHEAIQREYRFYSFGDAMLILP